MSRIGNQKIIIPENVTIDFDGEKMTVKGPLGTLERTFLNSIKILRSDNKISLERTNENKKTKMLHGTYASLIKGMIDGVTKGFTKELEIVGVGYNVLLQNNALIFSLGYSHKINLIIPNEIKVEVPKPTQLKISGINKEKVGQFAAKIRLLKKPEPYGGKGIRYKNEVIIRKAGKSSSK
ncbi:50S ribosomal protein L6 [Candidatus Hepatoplasma crinochetorum]|jgi:large subunit ribosomal protein L6|uniref:Large ribosomal subunit protein uL6 n=1 Tax=Candidatus Hepatoplasma crinochetorum Av TaxID=1427984 RepID=W8GSW2_9MOLU|nr:50S ribosomal protein L6 [Candidatus Hepatoplasma crinochetorum]AHK22500.1 50S ribosomal protein L6 [Candidatus Hepatoplasma crinochetorum Av]BDV03083.1 MAG: 50S ribosomal protein L6 [Candidatus Hepatoplasma crinochetorum]